MKVLVGCECSGIVREAFRRRGHDAWSCDFDETEIPGQHIRADVKSILADGWDMAIFHPPCTYLSVSGLHWNKRRPERAALTEEALKFVVSLMACSIPKIAIENPVGCISSQICKPTQIIQPYWFGDDASKKTCLWLFNLPKLPLLPSLYVQPRRVNGKERWSNQTDSGQNRETPSDHRQKDRSRTYQGIANSMAATWG